MRAKLMIAGASVPAILLSACGSETEPQSAMDAGSTSEVVTAEIPESLAPFGDGFPDPGDPCRKLGESPATSQYLDDSAQLVGCPTEATADAIAGEVVGNVDGIRLVSVPLDSSLRPEAPVPKETAEPEEEEIKPKPVAIRGPDSLESRCSAKVASETGAKVLGTNRIEESEAAIGIYVNVEGAQAPWRCLTYRDGTVGEVMYTGDEGAL